MGEQATSHLTASHERRAAKRSAATTCPICRAGSLHPVLHRRDTPVHQNLPAATPAAARACARGDILLVQCLICGFVFNAAFDEALLSYSPEYENAQDQSPAFRSYLEGLAAELTERYGLTGKTIVEIGCGKGEFLSRLCEAGRNRGIGYDPSYVAGRDRVAPGVTIVPEIFPTVDSRVGRSSTSSHPCPDPLHAGAKGDLVCSRHVIEHIAEPRGFLESVRNALGAQTDAALFFETPDLEWILEHRAFWDIFYEHCSYFAPPVLAYLFRACGFEVTSTRRAFGGQYQWLEAQPVRTAGSTSKLDAAAVARLTERVRAFAAGSAESLAEWRRCIEAVCRRGKCTLWGAGAKGVTFLNTLQLDADTVPMVVDINPRKHGRFIPGTAQPIVPPEALREGDIRTVLVMNPNYLAEIRSTVEGLGLDLEIASI